MTSAIEKFNKHYTEIVKKIDEGFSDLKVGERMLIVWIMLALVLCLHFVVIPIWLFLI